MATVNVGIVGAGWWACFSHIPAILAHPEARLHSVQKRILAEAEKVARDFGAAHAYCQMEEMLAAKDLDAVIVSSTPNMHFEQTKAALERGLHVLVEKPMTLQASEARELVELAAANKLELLISCPWHYTRHGLEARRLIQQGRLGRIKMISLLMTNPIDRLLKGIDTSPTHGDAPYLEPRPGSYSDPSIAGGGQIYCQVSHAAAYLSFLTGSRPKEVFARFDYDGSPVDIYDGLSMRLENGAIVSIASTGATPLAERHYEVRIYGTQAILLLELWRGEMSLLDFNADRVAVPPLGPDEVYPDRAPTHNLIEVILGREPNLSPGTLGLAAMEVIEAACRSVETGQNWAIR